MTWWPWTRTGCDQTEVEAAKRRAQDLETRTAEVAEQVRERDPWAGRVLDAIHQHPREPRAHL